MDYSDLAFFGERELQDFRPPRDLERWILILLSLPSPIPYIISSAQSFMNLCDAARCSWNLEQDTADYTDIVFFVDRPLCQWKPMPVGQRDHRRDTALIECRCCFCDYNIVSTVSCPAGHFFCSQCFATYASTRLGAGDPELLCMDTSGCSLPFHLSECAHVIPPKLISLRSRLVTKKELRAANLDNFEECPFCDWGCIMETPVQRTPLFRCQNWENGCGVASCRKCKKKSHLPRPCEEEEGKREARLAVEEAMSKALVRNCPKCAKGAAPGPTFAVILTQSILIRSLHQN